MLFEDKTQVGWCKDLTKRLTNHTQGHEALNSLDPLLLQYAKYFYLAAMSWTVELSGILQDPKIHHVVEVKSMLPQSNHTSLDSYYLSCSRVPMLQHSQIPSLCTTITSVSGPLYSSKIQTTSRIGWWIWWGGPIFSAWFVLNNITSQIYI